MKEQHSSSGDHDSDNQERQPQIDKSDSSHHNIQDAVFEMISEKDELIESKETDLQKVRKEPEGGTVSRKIKTYIHGREYANKGNLFDFSV